jgi:hypothetical protein
MLPIMAILSLAGTAASAAADDKKAKIALQMQKDEEKFADEQRKAQYRNEFRSALGRAIGAGREAGFVPDNPRGPRQSDYQGQLDAAGKMRNIGGAMTFMGENGDSMISGLKGNYDKAQEAKKSKWMSDWEARNSSTVPYK